MRDLEHLIAIYYDDDGRHTIRADELEDDLVFECARQFTLYDQSEQSIIYPRDITGRRRHFFEPPSENKRSVYGAKAETDWSHDRRVEEHFSNLLYCHQWQIGFHDNGNFTKLFDIADYNWDQEVYRILSRSAVVRHDLFGQRGHIGMSVFQPWIAIEVINTHYPEPQAFDAMIQMSAQVPLLVFFDPIGRRDYFFQIDPSKGTIRCTYYIFDGKVWNGDQPTTIDSAGQLQAVIENRLRRLKVSSRSR